MPSNPAKFTPDKSAKENRSHGWGITLFSAIILVVIVVTFIGAPVVSQAAGQQNAIFGDYDGIPIEFMQGNTFAKEVEQITRFYEQFNTGSTNMESQRQFIWRQAFDQTAVQVALEQEAKKAGIVITQAEVDEALVHYPAYLKDGVFNQELYNDTGSSDRFRYMQETKTQLLIQKYVQDQTQGPMVSSVTKDFVASMAYPQRKFSFVTFTDTDFPDSALLDYAQKNTKLFRTIDLSRISVTTSEADARTVRDEAVKGNKTFGELAKTYSKDSLADVGGELNVKHYYELTNEVPSAADLDKIFALPKGGLSAIIHSGKTWSFYRVNTPATDPDLKSSDTMALIRVYLSNHERGVIEDNLTAQATAFTKAVKDAKGDFEKVAKLNKKPVSNTDWVGVNYGNLDLFPSVTQASKNEAFQGLVSNDAFFKTAFGLAKGATSTPILASPTVFVVKVDDVKAAPAAADKPVNPSQVESVILHDRSQELQQKLLASPLLHDRFQAEYARLFPVRR